MNQLSTLYGDTLRYEKNFAYCPGCGHGIVTRVVAETIEKLGVRDKTVSIVGIGCGGFSHHYMNIDGLEAMHGRAPAMAVGYKMASPDNIVFTYQGDGDMSAIGLAELMHTANRGLPMTCIMVNNSVFGMTGGQMSSTSLAGQQTATTPLGRDTTFQGHPLKVPEMMREMDGVKYLAREAVTNARSIRELSKSLENAFRCQIEGIGFAFVEVIVPCPTGLKMNVLDSYRWCEEEALNYFKPQTFKNELEAELSKS